MQGIAAVFLIFMVVTAHASSDLAWLYQNLDNSEVVVRYAQGKIDGGAYAAVVANTVSPEEGRHPAVVIFRSRGDGRHTLLAEFEIGEGVSTRIANNSIYIRQDYAHHGIRFIQYQFRRVGGEFKMIGIESQDISLSEHSGVYEKERDVSGYKSREMWSGTRTNLLTARSECWLKTLNMDDSPANRIQQARAQSLFERGDRPKNPAVGEVRFARTTLLPLSEFELDGRREYFYPTCYFDDNKRLHKITSPPK